MEYFGLKNDGEKWSRKNIFEIPSRRNLFLDLFIYSNLPNNRVGPKNRVGGRFHRNPINVQVLIRLCRKDFFSFM